MDGGDTATVSVSVTCEPDAVVANDDEATVDEDSSANVLDVLANDSNADDDDLNITAVGDPGHGAATVVTGARGADDTVTYTPDADDCGDDSFTYRVNDGDSATVTVHVTCVDDAPNAVADSKSLLEGADATAIDVLANDTDKDGGTKSVASATQPAHGTVVVSGGGTGLTYKPAAGYCDTTPDTFKYKLNGGSEATVSVTVTCVDDPPPADQGTPADPGTPSGPATPSGPVAPTTPAGQPEPPSRLTIVSHRNVVVNSRGALFTFRCTGTAGATCAGSAALRATSLTSRLRPAQVSGAKTSFGLSTGKNKNVRLAIPKASRKQLAKHGKAVARIMVTLEDGTVVKKLVTLHAKRR